MLSPGPLGRLLLTMGIGTSHPQGTGTFVQGIIAVRVTGLLEVFFQNTSQSTKEQLGKGQETRLPFLFKSPSLHMLTALHHCCSAAQGLQGSGKPPFLPTQPVDFSSGRPRIIFKREVGDSSLCVGVPSGILLTEASSLPGEWEVGIPLLRA